MLALLLAAAIGASPSQPSLTLPDSTHVTLEVAVTDQERATGLMFRDELCAECGMLFVFESSDRWPFWMKNTMISLDFIWLDEHGRITDVLSDVQPCRRDPCPSYEPMAKARAMLEVNAGFAKRHGLVPGTLLRWSGVTGYPLSGAEQ